MLAQGGEFAFVLLSLAKELKVLPDELNRLLIIVVVLSMALTPLLGDLGSALGEYYRRTDRDTEGGAITWFRGFAAHFFLVFSLFFDFLMIITRFFLFLRIPSI